MVPEQVDVAIVGCGPVGALMGNLLGRFGVKAAIFEREATAHGIPRAFSCDDEAIRIYQQAGLAEPLLADMVQCPIAEFADARGQAFAAIHFCDVDFGLGYSALNFFHQPALEAVLRAGLERFGDVTLHLGHEVESLRQDASAVHLSVRDRARGVLAEVRATYALGCDGRRSAARRLAGIDLVGSRYAEQWLAVSGDVAAPPPSMPAARFVCDPFRPAFVARGAQRQCRWEFMLRPEETAAEMERPAAIARLLTPYVDPRQVEITRASVYTFENKSASRWRDRRLFLLGDSAHTMPPFMGQGLVSGLRDAANLAWKLAFVLRGSIADRVLDTYEAERRAHTKAMADISVRLGYVFLARDERLVWVRDTLFRALDRIPRVRRFIQHAEFKPLPVHERGLMIGTARRPGGPEGTLFPQPHVRTHAAGRVLLDEALGRGFAVLGYQVDPRRLLSPSDDPIWSRLETRLLRIIPAGQSAGDGEIVDLDGKLSTWFARHRADLAILRPDRFVFGAAPAASAAQLARDLRDALLP